MNVAVLGGGWFGCHLAKHLLSQGHHVTIFEREHIFAEASGNNQDRVHQGFHYPRSAKTRSEISYCYERFIKTYPTVPIKNNIYAVADQSIIDFPTYLAICRSAKLEFEIVRPEEFGLVGCEGAIRTDERVVDTAAVKEMFLDELLKHTRHTEVQEVRLDGRNRVDVITGGHYFGFNAVLNCTNLRLPSAHLPVFYEAALIMEAEGPADHPSLTVMDGAFPTILATPERGKFTVSHVTHTAVAKCNTYEGAQKALNELPRWKAVERFTDSVSEFCPAFRSRFKITGSRGAVRTKPVNGTDSRECLTHTDGRIMTVVCGKFASVFIAEERVDLWLKQLV